MTTAAADRWRAPDCRCAPLAPRCVPRSARESWRTATAPWRFRGGPLAPDDGIERRGGGAGVSRCSGCRLSLPEVFHSLCDTLGLAAARFRAPSSLRLMQAPLPSGRWRAEQPCPSRTSSPCLKSTAFSSPVMGRTAAAKALWRRRRSVSGMSLLDDAVDSDRTAVGGAPAGTLLIAPETGRQRAHSLEQTK